MSYNIFWFRRDLRLKDNVGLFHALSQKNKLIPLFIFDKNIIDYLPKDDPRISFIYNQLSKINEELQCYGSSLLVLKGDPKSVIENLISKYNINTVFSNEDYEPYALDRDRKVTEYLKHKDIFHKQYKDQVVFSPLEILKDDGNPYTVYTPYKNKWLSRFRENPISIYDEMNSVNFHKHSFDFPTIEQIGFEFSKIQVRDYTLKILDGYKENRDVPYSDQTSYLSVHLRFGTVSIRQIINQLKGNEVFLSELIWREFFMQILYNFPYVVNNSFKSKYDKIEWRNNKEEFKKWCEGKTGYPIVDAGMRQLNQTGYMHNRVRMIVAGFLCKHLLIDWRWGEKYFAKKLLDYELSSNNGNWQWAAGTGCDAAPYFRIFNPFTQQKKFDKEFRYIKRWIDDFDEDDYSEYIVDHKEARVRALTCYKSALD